MLPVLKTTGSGGLMAPEGTGVFLKGATAGSGLAKLTPAMEALDTTLRAALSELAGRNQSVLEAIRDTAEAVLPKPAASPSRPSQQPTQRVPGSLVHAATSPGVTHDPAMAAAHLPDAPASLAGSPARISTALAATRPVGSGGGVASPLTVLGPRWGATEGGRDGLGWVRSLVKYGETSPLFQADAHTGEVTLDSSGMGFKRAVFPSLKADRREDAGLLAQWLQDMVAQLTSKQAAALAAQVQGVPSPLARPGSAGRPATDSSGASTTILDLADHVLQVYSVAFEELKRQVASECKDRAGLLSTLWEHWTSAVELRTSLAAEARIGAMQAEYAKLMAARDELHADVLDLNHTVQEKDRDLRTAENATVVASRSLAGKLAAAQAQAEELNSHYKIADMALSNEVERRVALDKQLETTKQLLLKSEHERLTFRSQVTQLEAKNQGLQEELQKAHNELAAAAVAAETAHKEFEKLMETHVTQEVDMSRMKREFETDEILIVSFKQQVRDLEAQLSQLKAFQRDQALKLGAVAADKEALEADKAKLQDDLSTANSKIADLEKALADCELTLSGVRADLAERNEAYVKLQNHMEAELAAVQQRLNDVMTDLRQTHDQLSDTQHKLALSDNQRREMQSELNSLRDMLNSVSRTLDAQGVDGVPKHNDNGWAVMGPLGAAQRAVMVAGRQLMGLWERLEGTRQELATITERLDMELKLMDRLREELNTSKAAEAQLMAEKEEALQQLDIAHQAKRVLESEMLTSTNTINQLESRISLLEAEKARDQQELEELRPLRIKTKELSNQVEDLSNSLRVTSAALVSAKQDVAQLTEMQAFYKKEADRLMTDNDKLLDRIKELVVFESEVVEVRGECSDLRDELEDTRQRLNASLATCADTLHQLEIARFFLQGLDLVPPQSPMSSTASQPVHTRSRAQVPSTGEDTLQPGSPSARDIPQAEVSWRPTTAPSTVNRITSARRSKSEKRLGDAQVFQVSHGSPGHAGPGASLAHSPSGAGPHSASPPRQVTLHSRSKSQGGALTAGSPVRHTGSHTHTHTVERCRLLSGHALPRATSSHYSSVQYPDDSEHSPTQRLSTTQDSPGRIESVNSLGGPSLRDLTHSSGSLRASMGSRSGSEFGGPSSPSQLLSAAGFVRRSSSGRPHSAGARPMSAISQVSTISSSTLNADMPPEVAAMLQQRGVGQKLDNSAAKWMKFKLQIMASFSAKLRAQLLEVTERCKALEVELVKQQAEALEAAIQREQEIYHDVLGNFRGQLERVRFEVMEDARSLKDTLPGIRRDLGSLCVISTTMGMGLKNLQEARDNRRDAACQSAGDLEPSWAGFLQSLPEQLPYQPLSPAALNEAIVRIYLRAMASVETTPVWGAMRSDTVYDSIMDHYAHQKAPGTFLNEFLRDVEGPVARILRCARLSAASTRAGMFANFTGVSPDGTVWPSQTWHFFLQLLHCLQILLAGTWHSTAKAWASNPDGAQVPLQVVYDLVGNLFNVQTPTDLNRQTLMRLSAIVLPGMSGPQVDLDALLLLLTTEYNAGNCPRAALLFPRRLTDGALFNVFNAQGHLPQADALADGRAASLISASPPGSPGRIQRSTMLGHAALTHQQHLLSASRPGTGDRAGSPHQEAYSVGPATPSRPSTALNGVPRSTGSAGALRGASVLSPQALLEKAGTGDRSWMLSGSGLPVGTPLESDGALKYVRPPVSAALHPR